MSDAPASSSPTAGAGGFGPGEYVRAVLNILEDSGAERDRLLESQKAMLNVLDDFDVEKGRLLETQKAVLNILDDLAAERERLERTQRELLRSEEEQRLLARAGVELSLTLDLGETLASIPRLCLPKLGDWCMVDLVEEDGQVRRWKSVAADPAETSPEPPEPVVLDRKLPHMVWKVLDSRRPALLAEVSPEQLESLSEQPAQVAAISGAGLRSALSVPLISRGRLLGALTVASRQAVCPYGPREQQLAETIGYRAALAIDNGRLYRAAQRAIQARDNVLSVVAHDLRNPLDVILMQAALLRPRTGQPERLRKQTETIERAVSRMNRLIQDLLDVVRMESGRLSVEVGRLDARQVVLDAVEGQRTLATAASLELRVELPPQLPEISADEGRLFQVLENLIGNAIKFNKPGGDITVGAQPRPGELLFWVTDTGLGIAAEDLPRLFDRFWQADKTRRRGAGLGLSIAKGLVEAHGGRMWVESTLDQGSTFFFTLPCEG